MANEIPTQIRDTLPPYAISDELLPVIEKLGLQGNCRQLAREGWTIVENAADPDFVERLRETIVRTAPVEPAMGMGSGAQLLDKDRVFAEAVLNPKLMAMAEFSVGRGFLLGSVVSTVRRKGSPVTPLHADQLHLPAPFPEHNMMLTACWACTDFTKEAGATMVLPGSRTFRRQPSEEEEADISGAVAMECPAGSVAMWDGNVWHGNWPRSLDGDRIVLHTSYYRLAMRPAEDYSDSADRLVEEFGAPMSQVLGRDDFLYKKDLDPVADHAVYIKTFNDAQR